MIAIIKYNAGNVGSVQNALDRLGHKSILTDDAQTIKCAQKVIFPGVGHAGAAMLQLKDKGLDKIIPTLKQPFLGICLGMQLLCKHSSEGDTICLGIFNCNVKKFPKEENVPHIGWNNITELEGELFLKLNPLNTDQYFVHSYYAEICKETIATCNYIFPFSATIKKKNFYGTQFHPEKSASVGEQILKTF